MTEAKGILAIILHAHLPYVRHPERERTLEELWLFEAITETYLPLLSMFERLAKDQVPCRITMSITPTLGSMLKDPLLVDRYVSHLDRMIELAEKELERTRFQPQFYPLAQMYHKLFRNGREAFADKYGGNLVAAFAKLQEKGLLEIITSAATHGYLPLMDRSQAIEAQINVGVNWYREHFHRDPEGFWLPECGYAPGIDQILHKYGIKYVILDTHGVMPPETSLCHVCPHIVPVRRGVFWTGSGKLKTGLEFYRRLPR